MSNTTINCWSFQFGSKMIIATAQTQTELIYKIRDYFNTYYDGDILKHPELRILYNGKITHGHWYV